MSLLIKAVIILCGSIGLVSCESSIKYKTSDEYSFQESNSSIRIQP